MKKTLRPYQKDALDELRSKIRETIEPLLVVASVGAGKSLIIAELLLIIERAGYRALCLTLNSDLINQNVETYRAQGGTASIYCAALSEKDYSNPIVFASPHSIHAGLKTDKKLKAIRFNLIVIDEAHNVNTNDKNSMYIRLLNHYGHLAQSEQYSYRVVGLTGTPFRGKGFDIVGKNSYFKHKLANITTAWLIKNGYLVDPHFGLPKEHAYDFSKIKIMNTGKFDGTQLQQVIDENHRLTGRIMQEVQAVVEKRNGAFIFASTIKHCEECYRALPPQLTVIITGKTPSAERIESLRRARAGEIKYIVNVNVCTVGVDVPNFDTVVFVRPTESLVLYTQAIGRGLRLHETKSDCLILDYAGNLERHGNIDNPIINKALNDWADQNPDYCIPCFDCNTLNTVNARRCIGLVDKKSDKVDKDSDKLDKERCDHYFEFRKCHKCETINDVIARHCRSCDAELIDPNAKLAEVVAVLDKRNFDVLRATYNCGLSAQSTPCFRVVYTTVEEGEGTTNFTTTRVHEQYSLTSIPARNVFYHKFLKKHHPNYSESWLPLQASDWQYFYDLVKDGKLRTPNKLECVEFEGSLKINAKHFLGEVPQTTERTVSVICTSMRGTRPDTGKQLRNIEVDYLCVDDKENFIVVKDKYSFSKLSFERFASHFPKVATALNKIPEWDHQKSFLESRQCVDKAGKPDKLVINPNAKILSRSDDIVFDFNYTSHITNEYLEGTLWEPYRIDYVQDAPPYQIMHGVAKFENGYKIIRAKVMYNNKLESLFKYHQIKNFSGFQETRGCFYVGEYFLASGGSIKPEYQKYSRFMP